MKPLKKLLRYLTGLLLIPIIYLVISLILGAITKNGSYDAKTSSTEVYLSTNGVHLDIVIPKIYVDSKILKGLVRKETANYLAFGWGDENFYLNTPNWSDLTFKTAAKAMFLKSTSLMHVTRYQNLKSDWIAVKIKKTELKILNSYIFDTFKKDKSGHKIWLKDKGYSAKDDFYRANGSYSCFNTCNSWVNTAFKMSRLKCCLWTPFDFALLNKYR